MNARKKVCVLGGGISGLSAAYKLSKSNEVTLVEKKGHVGGWIDSLHEGEFFFETGPRTFPTRRAAPLISLAQELGLEEELIPTPSHVKRRYLWYQGDLQALPNGPLEALRSPFTKGLVSHLLLKEWRIPPSHGDETIWEFAKRRLGERAADLLFDPLAKGVYGGDAKLLSVEACLPFLKRLERESGSLVKGVFRSSKKSRPKVPVALKKSPLFTFQGGVSTLINALSAKIDGEVACGETVVKLKRLTDGWEVLTDKRKIEADLLVSALPAHVIGRLVLGGDPLLSIPYASLTLVHLGWHADVCDVHGFGYLIPSCEKERALGAIFDSSIFPQQSRGPQQTRYTFLFPGDERSPLEAALDAAERHLGVRAKPDYVRLSEAREAIPQYHLGHIKKVDQILREVESLPNLLLVGSYLKGVSVSDCVSLAAEIA